MNLNLIPSAKEAKMFGYEIRIDHAGVTSIVTVEASSLDKAVAIARRWFNIPVEITVLASIDRKPQTFLAG